MKKGAHRKFWGSVPYLAAAALSLMLLPSGPVNAGSCAIDSTCIFELTNSNVTELNGNIDIRVTINNTGASTVLSLQYISSNTADPLGLDKFGYNNAALVSSSRPCTRPCWNCSRTSRAAPTRPQRRTANPRVREAPYPRANSSSFTGKYICR